MTNPELSAEESAASSFVFSDEEARAWLDGFTRQRGRPLRVLHIGNIANNAYRAASLQRRHGIEADVVCYNYYHIMGCPEWEDATIKGDFDAFYPDWWNMDVGGFSRPSWFVQGPLPLCLEHLRARHSGNVDLQRETRFALVQSYSEILKGQSSLTFRPDRDILSPNHLRATLRLMPEAADSEGVASLATLKRWKLLRRLSRFSRPDWRSRLKDHMAAELVRPAMRRRVQGQQLRFSDRMRLGAERRWRKHSSVQFRSETDWLERRSYSRSVRSAARFLAGMVLLATVPAARASDVGTPSAPTVVLAPQPTLHESYKADNRDVPAVLLDSEWQTAKAIADPWRDVLGYYDVVQAYSTDGIIPLVGGHPAFACYEHGTIRDIPFENSIRGRLCRFTYKHAPRVFITNTDVIGSADRIPIKKDRRIYSPHVFDDSRLMAFRSTRGPSIKRPDQITIFSPTRHHWLENDPSLNKGNDVLLRGAALAASRGADFVLHLVAWGQHVEASKALSSELGLGDRIRWLGIMNRDDLWEALIKAHLVADQFTLPALGGVGYEALTLGARLLTNLDAVALEHFFGACPPAMIASRPEDVAGHILTVCRDPLDEARLGDRAAAWAQTYHSTALVHRLHMTAYRDLIGGAAAAPDVPAFRAGAAA